MENWQKVKLHPDMTILQAIEVIDSSSQQIGLVVNTDNKLLGTVTDGDVRRAILKGISLDKPVSCIMNSTPVTIGVPYCKEHVLVLMKYKQIHQIPIVDSQQRVIGLETMKDLFNIIQHDNLVVVMAGGLGSRLGELTKHCPKPLISVGGKPLLETIIESIKEDGFSNVCFSVNYKAEMIEKHFGDGSKWNVNIKYLREKKRMGTAGALSLLDQIPNKPIIIMNGDLLTKISFQKLLDYHLQHEALATMCVREYSFQVPYGVVRMDNGKSQLCGIEEKPVQKFFVSAGIYIVEPKALEFIPQETYFDMPSLFESIIEKGFSANVFPIREYWVDIGKSDDLERANNEYGRVFR